MSDLGAGSPPDEVRQCAEKLVVALDACMPEFQSMAVMLHVHGQRYDGPTFHAELAALRAALRSGAPGRRPHVEVEREAALVRISHLTDGWVTAEGREVALREISEIVRAALQGQAAAGRVE